MIFVILFGQLGITQTFKASQHSVLSHEFLTVNYDMKKKKMKSNIHVYTLITNQYFMTSIQYFNLFLQVGIPIQIDTFVQKRLYAARVEAFSTRKR